MSRCFPALLCFCRRRCGGNRFRCAKIKEAATPHLIWTDKLYCLICSFVLREASPFSLHFLPLTPPLLPVLPSRPALTVSASCPAVSTPPRGGGLLQEEGSGDGPPGEGTTREQACIIKTGHHCESKAEFG